MRFVTRYGTSALVTGASAGIGASFARALAARGLDLILVARRRERLDALAAELRAAHGVDVTVDAVDLLEEEAVESLQERHAEREIGLLVNNAGFGLQGRFLEQDVAALRRMVRLNCEVPVALASAFLPAMAARGRGGMIVVASVAGYLPTPWMAVYGATKGFDLLFGEALAVECAERGVDVEVLSPGSTATEFHALAGVDRPAEPGVERPALGGSRADPDDVVALVLDRVGKRAAHVPGWRNRIVSGLVPRLLPRRAAAAASGRTLRRRMSDA